MRNRIVGLMMIGVSALMGFVIYSFNVALTDIVNTSCSHGTSCPMWGTIEFQTNMSVAIMAFVVIIGIYLIFFGREERVITKVRKIKEQIEPRRINRGNYRKIMGEMESGERLVFGKIVDSNGAIYQSELVNQSAMSKVKVTRILDRLEGRGLIERKRRGMTNVVILKR